MKKILAINGDKATIEEVSSGLRQAGFEVITAVDSAEGLAKVYESKPDLVILADDLPLVNGEELCARLCQVSNVPIVALGSKEGELASVRMLELGADTYVPKPAGGAELLARVHSLLRRYKPRNKEADCGEDSCGEDSCGEDDPSALTSTESSLLSCLVLNEGSVVTHPQLLTEVWGGRGVSIACVKSYIRRLRNKRGPDLILNHRGVGYRFSAGSKTKDENGSMDS